MTDLEKLKRYVYPYYQETADETILTEYLTDYVTAYAAASALWGELPQYINTGNIKSINTGAETTMFHGLKEIEDFCSSRANYYSKLDKASAKSGSMLAGLVEPETIAGGAI